MILATRIAWAVAAILGVLLTSRGLVRAWGDLAVLRAAGVNGPRTIIARGHVRDHLMRSIALVLMAVAAGVAVSHGSGPSGAVAQELIRLASIGACLVMAAESAAIERDRRKIVDLLGAER